MSEDEGFGFYYPTHDVRPTFDSILPWTLGSVINFIEMYLYALD